MVGELDFDEYFNNPENVLFYPPATYIAFTLFVILTTILLMNLLVSANYPEPMSKYS